MTQAYREATREEILAERNELKEKLEATIQSQQEIIEKLKRAMRWIKASERLPESGDIIWRFIGQSNIVGCSYKAFFGFLLPSDYRNVNKALTGSMKFDEIEWLDESTDKFQENDYEEGLRIGYQRGVQSQQETIEKLKEAVCFLLNRIRAIEASDYEYAREMLQSLDSPKETI